MRWMFGSFGIDLSEDFVHIEEMHVRQAILTSLKAGDMVGFAHPFNRIQCDYFLALILGDRLDVTFIAGIAEIVNDIVSQIG